jgi:hypothetical protein
MHNVGSVENCDVGQVVADDGRRELLTGRQRLVLQQTRESLLPGFLSNLATNSGAGQLSVLNLLEGAL